jgi:hypothetical protein
MTHASFLREDPRDEAGIDFDQSPRAFADARLDFDDAVDPHISGGSHPSRLFDRHRGRR